MPQFSFKAVDASGRLIDGVIDAATENDLFQRLSGQGLRVQGFARVTASPNVVRGQPQAGQSVVQPVTRVLPASTLVPVRTKRSTRMDLHFTFANIANLARAGFGAAHIFTELAARATKPQSKEAFASLASTSTDGQSISDAMARFPDIFPDGSIGAVRAGETGGYLPEACEQLSLQHREDHKIAWMVRLMRWAMVIGFLALPWAMAVTKASDKTMAQIFDSTQELSVGERIGMIVHEFWSAFFGLPLIIIAVFALVYVTVALTYKKVEKRVARHSLALKIPVIGRYARNESISSLGWHLSKLMSAGIHPALAWKLAAAAMPNEALGRQAAQAGLYATEASTLSEIAARSGVFPMDHQSLFFTGETSGQLPQALDQSSKLAAAEMNHSKTYIRIMLYGLYVLVVYSLGTVAVTTFYGGFYSSMIKNALKE